MTIEIEAALFIANFWQSHPGVWTRAAGNPPMVIDLLREGLRPGWVAVSVPIESLMPIVNTAEQTVQAAALRSTLETVRFQIGGPFGLVEEIDDIGTWQYNARNALQTIRSALTSTTAGQPLLDRLSSYQRAIAALDLILFPKDGHDADERQHMREQLVKDLAASMDSRGWAGTFLENCVTIEEITCRAERITRLEAQVAQLTKERDNAFASWRQSEERRRRLNTAIAANNTIKAGDAGSGYHIWLPDDDNHLLTISGPVVIDADHLREEVGRHLQIGMNFLMAEVEAQYRPNAGEAKGDKPEP